MKAMITNKKFMSDNSYNDVLMGAQVTSPGGSLKSLSSLKWEKGVVSALGRDAGYLKSDSVWKC